MMNLLVTKEINGEIICYGFSVGAYLLMELATLREIDKMVLVSPSPFFADLVDTYAEEDKKHMYVKNMKKTLHEMCNMIKCKKIEVYIGEKEADFMKEVAKKIADEFGVQLNIMKGMGHDKKLFEKVLSIK